MFQEFVQKIDDVFGLTLTVGWLHDNHSDCEYNI
jgi:hypothetical protein